MLTEVLAIAIAGYFITDLSKRFVGQNKKIKNENESKKKKKK